MSGEEAEEPGAPNDVCTRCLADPELRAIQAGLDLFANLDAAMRHRVLLYLCRRLDVRLLDSRFRHDLS